MTDSISACTSSRPFTPAEEDELHKDRSTSAILDKARRDAGIGGPSVEVRGDDKTWRATKEEQQGHVGVAGGLSIGHGVLEVVHFAELHAVETAAGGALAEGMVIAGAVGGFALGVHELHEAHKKGEEQSAALAKEDLHVAMLVQLDLPAGYKAAQIADRTGAGRSSQGVAQKMATPFATIDKPLVATMQLHADRGMHAGCDLVEGKLTKEQFFAANPKIADAYAKDPAFHDGFDSIVWAKQQGPAQYDAATDALHSRDCRYQQSHITYGA